jgi:hypothetical protein
MSLVPEATATVITLPLPAVSPLLTAVHEFAAVNIVAVTVHVIPSIDTVLERDDDITAVKALLTKESILLLVFATIAAIYYTIVLKIF